MHNVGQLYTTTESLSEQPMEFLFAPNSSELKSETTMYKSSELGQIVHVSRYDSIDFVDLHIVGNTVEYSVLLEQLEQN